MNEVLSTINAIDWTLFCLLVLCYACKNTWRQRYYNATSYRRQSLTYNTIDLGDILSDQELIEVSDILNESGGEDSLLKLKKYFLLKKEQLESKGIHDEYLAWAVYANCKLKMEK